MKKEYKILLYQLLILFIFLIGWEFLVSGSKRAVFLYGSPLIILKIFYNGLISGRLLHDTYITLSETIIGFIIGNVIGIILGLGLWYSKTVFKIVKPYIIILGSIPIFALAPLMIIWFGTGILSKIVLVVLSTFILSMVQSYKGASEVDEDKIRMVKAFGATKNQIFTKIIVPSSVVWVISAVKLNIGFALLGAFIGEFISSEAGLGHYIIVSSGLYDISSVFVGVIMIAIISLVLSYIFDKIEHKVLPWKNNN